MSDDDIIKGIITPIRLEFDFTPGVALSEGLRALTERRILAQQCPKCEKVYVPPKGSCARCGVACEGTFEIPDTGIVTTFCIVDIPFAGQAVECPYVSASILLDGADLPLFHLLQEVEVDRVTMGMRVQAVWSDDPQPSMETIKYFKPTGEPDMPLNEVLERLHA